MGRGLLVLLHTWPSTRGSEHRMALRHYLRGMARRPRLIGSLECLRPPRAVGICGIARIWLEKTYLMHDVFACSCLTICVDVISGHDDYGTVAGGSVILQLLDDRLPGARLLRQFQSSTPDVPLGIGLNFTPIG